jgi:hypothetical protein
MRKRKRGTAAAGAAAATGSRISRFARNTPILVAAFGVALGAVVGSFFRLTPEEKKMLAERAGKLKEQANKLKGSASELAIEGYDQIRTTLEGTPEALKVSGENQSARSVEENPLVISDSAR